MDENNEQVTARPAKIPFAEICTELQIGYEDLDSLDWLASVPNWTFYQMRIGQPVLREDAEKVLIALSAHADVTHWTLDTVEVALLPTPLPSFADAFGACPMEYQTLAGLAARCGIPHTVLVCMHTGQPVERVDAEKIFAILSLYTDHVWSLDTTFVPLRAPITAKKLNTH